MNPVGPHRATDIIKQIACHFPLSLPPSEWESFFERLPEVRERFSQKAEELVLYARALEEVMKEQEPDAPLNSLTYRILKTKFVMENAPHHQAYLQAQSSVIGEAPADDIFRAAGIDMEMTAKIKEEQELMRQIWTGEMETEDGYKEMLSRLESAAKERWEQKKKARQEEKERKKIMKDEQMSPVKRKDKS